jgi:hypothetical protein
MSFHPYIAGLAAELVSDFTQLLRNHEHGKGDQRLQLQSLGW